MFNYIKGDRMIENYDEKLNVLPITKKQTKQLDFQLRRVLKI